MSTPLTVTFPATESAGFPKKDGKDRFRTFVHSALDDFGLSLAEYRVYARIVRRTNGDGDSFCSESVPNMARRLRISHHTVRAALKALGDFGMIKERRHPGHVTKFSPTPRKEWAFISDQRGRTMLRLVPKSDLDDGRPTLFIPAKLDDYGLSLVEFAFFLRIVRLAGKRSYWIHVPTAAKRLGVSVRTARDAMKVLAILNMIVRARDGKGHRLSVNLPSEWAGISALTAIREQSQKSKESKNKRRAEEVVNGAQRNTKVSPPKVSPDSSDSKANHLRSHPPLRAFAKSAHVLAPPLGGVGEFLRNESAFGELTTMEDLYPTMSASSGG